MWVFCIMSLHTALGGHQGESLKNCVCLPRVQNLISFGENEEVKEADAGRVIMYERIL